MDNFVRAIQSVTKRSYSSSQEEKEVTVMLQVPDQTDKAPKHPRMENVSALIDTILSTSDDPRLHRGRIKVFRDGFQLENHEKLTVGDWVMVRFTLFAASGSSSPMKQRNPSELNASIDQFMNDVWMETENRKLASGKNGKTCDKASHHQQPREIRSAKSARNDINLRNNNNAKFIEENPGKALTTHSKFISKSQHQMPKPTIRVLLPGMDDATIIKPGKDWPNPGPSKNDIETHQRFMRIVERDTTRLREFEDIERPRRKDKWTPDLDAYMRQSRGIYEEAKMLEIQYEYADGHRS